MHCVCSTKMANHGLKEFVEKVQLFLTLNSESQVHTMKSKTYWLFRMTWCRADLSYFTPHRGELLSCLNSKGLVNFPTNETFQIHSVFIYKRRSQVRLRRCAAERMDGFSFDHKTVWLGTAGGLLYWRIIFDSTDGPYYWIVRLRAVGIFVQP